MFDRLTNFGLIKLTGSGGSANTAAAEYEIDMVAGATEDCLHDLRIVVIPKKDSPDPVTFTLKTGDESTSLTAMATFVLKDFKANTPQKVPFPLEHKRYLGIEANGEVTLDFFVGLEFGA